MLLDEQLLLDACISNEDEIEDNSSSDESKIACRSNTIENDPLNANPSSSMECFDLRPGENKTIS